MQGSTSKQWRGHSLFKGKKPAQIFTMTSYFRSEYVNQKSDWDIREKRRNPPQIIIAKSIQTVTNKNAEYRDLNCGKYKLKFIAPLIQKEERIIPTSSPPHSPSSLPPTPQDPLDDISTKSPNEQREEKIPLSLIIGQADNGKTFIMKLIFDGDVRNDLFKPQLQESLKYYFVDTSSFDFDSDYDSREKQIANYKNLFKEYPNRVRSILIVVNFERTDLMKKKVSNITKVFGKFSKLYTFVITKFHLSENIERDKAQLIQSFKYLKAQDMIFVGEDTKKTQLWEDLGQKSLPPLEDGYEFNLVDTFFEEDNTEEIQQQYIDLQKQYM